MPHAGRSDEETIVRSRRAFPAARTYDDVANVLDRFYVKLLHISSTVTTAIGQAEAHRRAKFMRKYLRQLGREIRADHKPEEDS